MNKKIQTSRGPKNESTILKGLDALELMPQILKALNSIQTDATHDGLKNCELISKVRMLVNEE